MSLDHLPRVKINSFLIKKHFSLFKQIDIPIEKSH